MIEEKGKRTLTIWLDIDVWNVLHDMAHSMGESKTEIVRRLISDAMPKVEPTERA